MFGKTKYSMPVSALRYFIKFLLLEFMFVRFMLPVQSFGDAVCDNACV